MEKKTIFLEHNEVCEMFDMPPDKMIVADEDAVFFRPDVKMWGFTLTFYENEAEWEAEWERNVIAPQEGR